MPVNEALHGCRDVTFSELKAISREQHRFPVNLIGLSIVPSHVNLEGGSPRREFPVVSIIGFSSKSRTTFPYTEVGRAPAILRQGLQQRRCRHRPARTRSRG